MNIKQSLLICCIVAITGAGAWWLYDSNNTPKNIAQIKTKSVFEPMEANKDYSNNISGKWMWYAFPSDKEKKVALGLGAFMIKEVENNQIIGQSISTRKIPVQDKAAKDKKAVLEFQRNYLKGSKNSNSNIQFAVINDKQNTNNTAKLSEKGTVMTGYSTAGSQRYYWEAYRVSDNEFVKKPEINKKK